MDELTKDCCYDIIRKINMLPKHLNIHNICWSRIFLHVLFKWLAETSEKVNTSGRHYDAYTESLRWQKLSFWIIKRAETKTLSSNLTLIQNLN